jgi:hypothetical protein
LTPPRYPRSDQDLDRAQQTLAGESTAQGYRAGVTGPAGQEAAEIPLSGPARAQALASFEHALDLLLADDVDTDALIADPGAGDVLRAELDALSLAKRRIDTRICRGVGALHRVEQAAAETQAPNDPRAGAMVARDLGRELGDRLGMSPTQVKTARQVGNRIAASPVLADALDSGAITQTHARILERTLKTLTGTERETLQTELVAAASTGMSVQDFGRLATRRLARLDRHAAEEAELRRNSRRRAGLVQTDDGLTALHGQWSGLQAEIAQTAVHAFRRHDVAGEHRTAEMRTADAVIAAFQAALDAGTAAANRGVRPHIIVTVDLDTVTGSSPSAGPAASGIAEGTWTGPIVWGAVKRVLADSAVSFITVGNDLPILANEEVRTVPVGLYRLVADRDKQCIHVGCDMPPAWCEFMHLENPYAKGGRLSLRNAALGCTHHHRQYDNGELELRWDQDRPSLHPPDD